jgi:universal stress protein A
MKTFDRILVPVDFSQCSRTALNYAISLADQLGAKLRVLHICEVPALVSPDLVVTIPDQPTQTISEWVKNEAELGMDKFMAEVVKPDGLDVEVKLVTGDAPEMIAKEADAYKADLVVMGTHGRKGVAHLIMGSVAERTLRISPCPVLTIRTSEKE